MYAKVFTQIYDGTLCTKGPWQALVTFQQLLVLADQDGNVDMTAAAIARRTTIPLEIIELGIAELLQPDPESRTPTEEGRRLVPLSEGRSWGWRIVNYKHYRELKREEDRRQYHREYWHKRKLKQDKSTQHDSTGSTKSTEAYAEAEAKEVTTERKRSTRAEPVSTVSVQDLVLEGVDKQQAADWLKLRRDKKLALTRSAWDAIKEQGQSLGMSPAEVVKTCNASSWAGFKASWLGKEDQGKSRSINLVGGV